MITFDLQCTNAHTFEGWFEDSKAYETQNQQRMIMCPVCNDTEITKIMSGFAIKSSEKPPPVHDNQEQREMLNTRLSDFVEKNFDNVGEHFSEEALKMHYGVVEPRNIMGVSSQEQDKTLRNEGVKFFKIPAMPDSSGTDSTGEPDL